VLLLQNLAAVAAAATVALATATAIVFVADGLAALAVVTLGRRRAPRAVVAVATVALATIAWGLTGATGVAFVALVVVGQVAATLLLGRAFAASSSEASLGAHVAGVAAGMVVLGLTLFLYQLHYDRPLPVSNRWLPVLAAIVLGIASLAAPTTEDAAVASQPSRATRRGAFALAGAIVALATVVVIGVAAGEPDVTSTTATRAPRRATVMTFNVHNAVTRDGQLDPDRIADVAQRVDPDVLVLEEAGRGWPLSSTIDLAEWMKRRLDLPYRWAPAADHTMGNLIFSKIPIRDARVVQLPQGTGTMRRSAIVARVGPVGGRDMTIAGVHLQNGSSPDRLDTRIRELDVLLRALGSDRAGVVIAGDLNADPGERDLRHVLDAGFTTTQPTKRCTLKTSNDNCVDWILVTEDLLQGPPRVVRVPQFDHNAVVTEIGTR
jgi:endonuclease/exonuclease/phosphatase family metal-dependent hydrolase